MKRKMLAVFCLLLAVAATVSAQRRTVTNMDLDRYRQDRVRAEQDLRENYAKLGFSSPEERAKRDAESRQVMMDLADRLREQRLERERIEAERATAEATAAAAYYNSLMVQQPDPSGYYDGGYFPPYGDIGGFGIGRGRRGSPFRFGGVTQEGYFGGGQFWPTGSRTPSRPLWQTPRPTRTTGH